MYFVLHIKKKLSKIRFCFLFRFTQVYHSIKKIVSSRQICSSFIVIGIIVMMSSLGVYSIICFSFEAFNNFSQWLPIFNLFYFQLCLNRNDISIISRRRTRIRNKKSDRNVQTTWESVGSSRNMFCEQKHLHIVCFELTLMLFRFYYLF